VREMQRFTCPRCGTEVAETYYGPCRSCRDELRAEVAAEARDVGEQVYEPKMNVTPNAVALRDD
jgi:NMD protein affecting ribosome stability and mRNA decay